MCNKLSLNIDQSNFVIFYPPQKKCNHYIKFYINNKLLKQEASIRYLGILIDLNLNWKCHITHICKNILRDIGLLSKIRYYVENHILAMLYYSLIHPFLIYGLIAWGNIYPTNTKKIVTLQKKAICIITFSRFDDHTSPLFKQLYLLKFVDLIYFHTALFMYQSHSNILPTVFNDFFSPVSKRHKYNTRLASQSFSLSHFVYQK